MSPYLVITLVLIYIAHLLTLQVTDLYLSLAIKVLFVGTTYCLTLWLLRSTIFRESIEFLSKRNKS